MKRVEENGTWSFFCSELCPGLSNCYGDDYEKLSPFTLENGAIVESPVFVSLQKLFLFQRPSSWHEPDDANDSSTYTEIDLQTNQFFLQTDGDSLNYNTNFNHYMTNNSTAFKKYVWRFTEGHSADYVGLGEMELYDVHASSTGITNQFTITCAVRPHTISFSTPGFRIHYRVIEFSRFCIIRVIC